MTFGSATRASDTRGSSMTTKDVNLDHGMDSLRVGELLLGKMINSTAITAIAIATTEAAAAPPFLNV